MDKDFKVFFLTSLLTVFSFLVISLSLMFYLEHKDQQEYEKVSIAKVTEHLYNKGYLDSDIASLEVQLDEQKQGKSAIDVEVEFLDETGKLYTYKYFFKANIVKQTNAESDKHRETETEKIESTE